MCVTAREGMTNTQTLRIVLPEPFAGPCPASFCQQRYLKSVAPDSQEAANVSDGRTGNAPVPKDQGIKK